MYYITSLHYPRIYPRITVLVCIVREISAFAERKGRYITLCAADDRLQDAGWSAHTCGMAAGCCPATQWGMGSRGAQGRGLRAARNGPVQGSAFKAALRQRWKRITKRITREKGVAGWQEEEKQGANKSETNRSRLSKSRLARLEPFLINPVVIVDFVPSFLVPSFPPSPPSLIRFLSTTHTVLYSPSVFPVFLASESAVAIVAESLD
jgi:hypothetical protein